MTLDNLGQDTSLFVQGIDTVGRLGQFNYNRVSPSYFATVGTRIIPGRGIGAEDRPGAPKVLVVSEAMVRTLWPGRDPIGQCIRVGADTAGRVKVMRTACQAESYFLPGIHRRTADV
jgi:hypothetical protein